MSRHSTHCTDSTRKQSSSQGRHRQGRAKTQHAVGLVAEALEQRMLLCLPAATSASPLAVEATAAVQQVSSTSSFSDFVVRVFPIGSLVYQRTTTGNLASALDTNTLTLPLDSGQTLSLLVRSGTNTGDSADNLQLQVELFSPDGSCLGSSVAWTVGGEALLQTVPLRTGGSYQVRISSVAGSGPYTAQATLGAAVEWESVGRQTNGTPSTAQDLDPAFSRIGNDVQCAAVLGTGPDVGDVLLNADFSQGDNGFQVDNSGGGLWHRSSGFGPESGHFPFWSFYYGEGEEIFDNRWGRYATGGRNSGSLISPPIALPSGVPACAGFNYILNTESSSVRDLAQLQINAGHGWTTLASYNQVAESGMWKASPAVDLSAYAGQTVQLRWFFDTVDNTNNNYLGWYVDDILVWTESSSCDYYSFTLNVGESAALAIKKLSGSGNLSLTLTDAWGNTLTQGTSVGSNVDEVIRSFRAPATGRYYIRVGGNARGPYNLVVTHNAMLDTEPNDSAAQDITRIGAVLGNVEWRTNSDRYAIQLEAGQRVRVFTSTPCTGPIAPYNQFDPKIELYDPSGVLIAADDSSAADHRNAELTAQVTRAGLYVLRVFTTASDSGEYLLQVENLPPTIATPGSLDLLSESDTGVSNADNITRLNSGLRFAVGNLVPGATVSLYADGQLVGSAVAGSNYMVIPMAGSAWLSDGVHQFTATQQVPGQEASSPSVALAVTIDTTAPMAPDSPVLQAGSDTGISNSDRITADNTPGFTVSGDPYYRVYRNGTMLVGGGYESYSTYTAATQPEGSWEYAITAVDAAGNESPLSPAITVTIDTSAPAQPAIPDLQAACDSGISNSDNITNQASLMFDVNAAPYYRFYSGAVRISDLYATGSSFTTSINYDGSYSYSVAALDVAGNESVRSQMLRVVVDRVAALPQMPTLASNSDSGAIDSDNTTYVIDPFIDVTVSEAGIIHLEVDDVLNSGAVLTVTSPGTYSMKFPQGPGWFKHVMPYHTPGHPGAVTVADINADGRLDLIVPSSDTPYIRVLLGGGEGIFELPLSIPAGSPQAYIDVADFNGDGKLDLVAADKERGFSIFLGKGDGTFSAGVTTITAPGHRILAADINGDRKADVLLPSSTSAEVNVFLGKGDGTFQPRRSVPAPAPLDDLKAADLNGDGKLDLAATAGANDLVAVMPGNGDGSFQSAVSYSVPAPRDLVLRDFNGDGELDLVTYSGRDRQIFMFAGKGDGGFAPAVRSDVGIDGVSLFAADYNSDGKLDLACMASNAPNNRGLCISYGRGDGTFALPKLFCVSRDTVFVSGGDFNSDGLPDAVVVEDSSDGVCVFLNSPVALYEGTHTIRIWIEDLAGNRSLMSDFPTVIIDTTPPEAPTRFDLQAASDTGFSNTDNYTDDHTPTFDVQAGPYYRVYRDRVQISRDNEGGPTYTAPAQPDGLYTYSVRTVDTAGNVSTDELKLQVAIGSILPTAPDLVAPSDTGLSSVDNLTRLNNSSSASTLTFRIAPVQLGTSLTLYADGLPIGSATATALEVLMVTNGRIALADGQHAITWQGTIPGQSQQVQSPPLYLTIDTQAPVTPAMPDLADASDSGVSNTDNITNDNTPTLLAGSGEYFRFYCDGWQVGSDYEKSCFDPQPLSDGAHVIRVAAIDAAGNFSPLSPALSLTIDTVAPNAPGAISLDPASDTGRSNSDRITKDNTPTFNISLRDTAYYRLFVDGERVGSDYQTDAQYTPPLQPDGKHNYALRAVDIAGNVSAASADVYVTIDTVAPAIPAIPDLDASSDSGISDTDDITNRLAVAFNLDASEAGTLHLDIDGLASKALLNTDQAGSYLLSVPLLRMDFVAKDDSLISKASNLLADLDADGFPDCLYAAPREGLFVAIGKGDGSFHPYQRLPIQVDSTFYSFLAVADFNEDGKPDIAVADHNIRVFLAKGDGTYQLGQNIPGDPVYLHFVVADFNADGHADLMTTDYFSDAPFFKIMLGNGDGTFRPAQTLITGDRPAAVRVADLNGDGAVDLIYSRPGIWSPSGWMDPKLAVHFGKGDGTFQSAIETSLEWPTDYLDIGDFNEDGKLDVLAIELCDAVLHLGHGDGTFTVAGRAQVAVEHSGMAVGDFDGDGHLDMAMGTGFNSSSSDDEIWVLRGQGDGTLLPAIRYPTLSSPASVLAADLNGDGRLDLLSSDGRPLLNNSTILSKGSHCVTAWLEDVAGNASQPSHPMSFTIDTTRPSADIVDVGPDPHSGGIDSMTITFDEAVVGFDLTDLSLCRDGGPNLLTAAQILTTSDSRTWLLKNLASLTGTPGDYTLHINASGSNIVDSAGNALKTPVGEEFTVINAPPVLDKLSSQTVDEGRELTFTAVAKDANLPAQKLTFSIDRGAPAGVRIDPDTGVFRWTPSGTQNGVFYVTIRATDNGTPPLSDSKTVSIAVINVVPTVVVGPDITLELGQSFMATGSFTDPGNDVCTATVDYGEGRGPQPLALTGNNFTLSHTYKSLGQHAVVVRVADPEGGSSSDQLIVQVNTSRLIAVSVGSNGSGFDVQFNRPINTSKLNLYDGVDATTDLPDLTFVGQNSGPVAGSLFWEAESNTLHFVKTGGVLPSDMYMITLFSRADGFVDDAGELLDGDNNGIAGGDFRSSFGLCSTLTPAITIPPFARGPGQPVNVPAAESGLPIQIDNAEGLRSADLTLRFNPALLTITDVTLAANMPDDWHVSTEQSTPGQLLVSLAGSTPLSRGSRALVRLKASVPRTAPYGESQAIELLGAVTTANGQLIGVPRVASVQLVAYVGDASGNKGYSGVDAAYIANVAIGAVKGFDAFPLIDPVIVGDVTGNGSLSALDAAYVAQKSVGIPRPEIPAPPAATPAAPLAATAAAITNTSIDTTSIALARKPFLPRSQRPALIVPWTRKVSEGLFCRRAIESEVVN